MAVCAFPITLEPGSVEVPCGRCMPCRINRRREWTARIVLEHMHTPVSSFLTLTYNEENQPHAISEDGCPVPTLYPRHIQLFIKSLRRVVHCRFFAVGEYGTQTSRPHYHLCIFGPDPAVVDASVGKLWTDDKGATRGFHQTTELTTQRAAYTAAYTVKKMMRPDDERLDGQHPEFARMSLRPPIGYCALPAIAASLQTREGSAAIAKNMDVPRKVRIEGKKYPLDKTMLRHLRQLCGIPVLSRDREESPQEFEYVVDLDRARGYHERMRVMTKRHGTL